MRVSIEWFMAVNFLMNAAILSVASGLSGLKAKKAVGAGVCLFGAAYALISVWLCPMLLSPPIKICVGLVIALGLRFGSFFEYLRGVICVFICAFILGGLINFLANIGGSYRVNGTTVLGGVSVYIACTALILALVMPALLRRLRTRIRLGENVAPLKLECDGGEYELLALIDSGNLLTEPVSQLPVVLVNDMSQVKEGRPVNYAGIGAGGEIICKRAAWAKIYINGAWRSIDVYVAPSPEHIIGADALIGQIALPPDLL